MSEPIPLYHWSPVVRRPAITRRGLVPGSWSTDRLWRPPYVCFSGDPALAWQLSGATPRGREVAAWDLWQTWSDVPDGYEEITDTYADTGRTYVKEIRVYQRIYKRDLWWVATREAR